MAAGMIPRSQELPRLPVLQHASAGGTTPRRSVSFFGTIQITGMVHYMVKAIQTHSPVCHIVNNYFNMFNFNFFTSWYINNYFRDSWSQSNKFYICIIMVSPHLFIIRATCKLEKSLVVKFLIATFIYTSCTATPPIMFLAFSFPLS